MKARFLATSILALVAFAGGAQAQSVKQSIDVTYEIASDLTVVRTSHVEVTPMNPASVQSESQQHFSYTANQTAEILEAYTRKADGTQIPVDQSQIVTQNGLVGAVTSYTDLKIMLIPFRDVDVGDTIVMTSRLTEREHYLPKQYSYLQSLPPTPAESAVSIRLKTPKALSIAFDAHGFSYDEQVTDSDIVRHWSGTFEPSHINEHDIANPRAIVPTLAFSTLPSYEALAQDYYAAAAPKAAVTPAIQQLADQITAGKDDKRRKAEAIFDWMTREVQYVGIYFGNGRYVPNDADTILSRRLGDCKDHATLMSALLAAEGISSEQVLINIGPDYELPAVPVLQAFNHEILYLPEFGLYADPTSPDTTFGVLNRLEMDKPVVRVSAAGAQVTRTPVGYTADNVYRYNTSIVLGSDGRTHGETRIEATGEEAQLLRDFVAVVEARGPDTTLDELARNRGISGGQDFEITAPSSRDHSLPYRVTARWTDDQLSHIMDASWRPPGGLSPAPLDFHHFLGNYDSVSKRTYPVMCRPGMIEQNITVTLPGNVLLPSVPAKVTVDGNGVHAERWWEISGQTLQVHTRLSAMVEHRVCSADIINDVNARLKATGNVSPQLRFIRNTEAQQVDGTK